ncbi:MAG: zinc-binding dehydrogenase [Pseudomonadota bacterium]|nr:zinc-binding dehydrogenase [Pseudomonadota bacterium]
MINGASGGVGTFAVQIAKAYGANVTGVCSTRNLNLVRSIGADQVIDDTHEDFTKLSQQYDLIIDTVGKHSLSDYQRVLKPNGALVILGSQDKGRWLGPIWGLINAKLYAPFVSQKFLSLLAELNPKDLDTLDQLQQLFTATFIGTFIASGVYTALASRVKLTRLLPGAFFLVLAVQCVLFELLFSLAPENCWLGSAYYVWFSVTNLFMISVFWSLMVDVFSPEQATRFFAFIAAGGALGAIAGPLLPRLLVIQRNHATVIIINYL